MADAKKARIFIRRGRDADRLQTALCEGELGYSTDGKRVFVGDGTTLGGKPLSSVHFKSSGFDITTLTSVSSEGAKAEVGDFLFVGGSDYQLDSINVNAANTTIDVNDSFGTLYALSADTAGLTWVAVNSGIPLTHIDIPLDSLSADQIHGGDFSGSISFSGEISAQAGVALEAVKSNAQVVPTGSIVYPLGITSNSQVTAISSIFDFGTTTVSQGNSVGYVKSSTTNSTSAISAINTNGSLATLGVGTNTATVATSAVEDYIGDFYTGDAGSTYASETGIFKIQEITYNETDIRKALHNNNIDWDQIEEFYFSVYANQDDDNISFMGFTNHSTGGNEILIWNGTSISGGETRNVPFMGRVTIPNTYTSTESLIVHLGMGTSGAGKISYFMTGVKIRT